VARCPTKASICGDVKEDFKGKDDDNGKAFQMSGSWSDDDICIYLFASECKVPMFQYSGSATDADFNVYYLEFSPDWTNMD
jgi:hypothetical protein